MNGSELKNNFEEMLISKKYSDLKSLCLREIENRGINSLLLRYLVLAELEQKSIQGTLLYFNIYFSIEKNDKQLNLKIIDLLGLAREYEKMTEYIELFQDSSYDFFNK